MGGFGLPGFYDRSTTPCTVASLHRVVARWRCSFIGASSWKKSRLIPPSSSDDTPQTPPNLIFTVRPGLSTEAALSNASEMLESATVCAYDCAEHLDGSGRKQVLAVVQMIEIAQLLVDQALNRECPVA